MVDKEVVWNIHMHGNIVDITDNFSVDGRKISSPFACCDSHYFTLSKNWSILITGDREKTWKEKKTYQMIQTVIGPGYAGLPTC